jgi:hypothetical protein
MKARENTIPPNGSKRMPQALDRLAELCTNLLNQTEVSTPRQPSGKRYTMNTR